jgi:hypothetical protein
MRGTDVVKRAWWLSVCAGLTQDRQCMCNVILGCVRVTSVAVKELSVLHVECVLAVLVIQHAMRMRRVTLPSVACPALRNFSALSHKRHDFRGGKVTEHKMRVLIFSTTFV